MQSCVFRRVRVFEKGSAGGCFCMLGQGRLRVLGNKNIRGEESTGAHIRQEGEVCCCPFSKYKLWGYNIHFYAAETRRAIEE